MISQGTKNGALPSQILFYFLHLKSSDAKASECHLKFSSRMIRFIKLDR